MPMYTYLRGDEGLAVTSSTELNEELRLLNLQTGRDFRITELHFDSGRRLFRRRKKYVQYTLLAVAVNVNNEHVAGEYQVLENSCSVEYIKACLRWMANGYQQGYADFTGKPTAKEPLPNDAFALARRTLHLAYVWNDHNFVPAQQLARETAQSVGIFSFEDAEVWLEAAGGPPLNEDDEPAISSAQEQAEETQP